jgi:hypothetical protein
MSKPPKLKVTGAAYQRLSNSPTRVHGHVCGGAPQTLSPIPEWRSMLIPPAHARFIGRLPSRISFPSFAPIGGPYGDI